MKYIYFLLVLFVGLAVTQADERCLQPIERGRCLAYMERYGFNGETGKCEMFIYGGCGGNENNFYSKLECLAKCTANLD